MKAVAIGIVIWIVVSVPLSLVYAAWMQRKVDRSIGVGLLVTEMLMLIAIGLWIIGVIRPLSS